MMDPREPRAPLSPSRRPKVGRGTRVERGKRHEGGQRWDVVEAVEVFLNVGGECDWFLLEHLLDLSGVRSRRC